MSNFSENIHFCEVVQWTTDNLYLVVSGQFWLSGTTGHPLIRTLGTSQGPVGGNTQLQGCKDTVAPLAVLGGQKDSRGQISENYILKL